MREGRSDAEVLAAKTPLMRRNALPKDAGSVLA
jgi:hypothetical protein